MIKYQLTWTPRSTITAARHIKNFHQLDKIKNIAIIAESHTRNLQYLSNLNSLKEIFTISGINTFISNLSDEFEGSALLQDADGKNLEIHKICKVNDQLLVNDQLIDLAILNNDLTNYRSEFFSNVKTPITPHPYLCL